MSSPIYLDYHSTTPVDRRVADKVYDYMVHNFGNSSSIDHIFGDHPLTTKIGDNFFKHFWT